MTVGICGLGLIGGSMAKAYREAGHRVLGYDIDKATEGYASLADIICGQLNGDTLSECELIFVALYPEKTIEYLEHIAPRLSKDTVVIDLCGTKRHVCEVGFALAKKYGFTFVGGHPMAGKQYSGIKYAKANLFKGAPMVLVPPVYDDIAFIDKIKGLLSPAGFGKLSVTTADAHDKTIAFTSQLAHVISSAYISSPTAEEQRGFSAGSFRDMTRVAEINAEMWSEILISNREPLLTELDRLLVSLSELREVISKEDEGRLRELLSRGARRKREYGG